MNNRPFILLIGHINVGKTTMSNYLYNKYNFKSGALGYYVKLFYIKLFEILNGIDNKYKTVSLEEINDRRIKEQHRPYLQDLSNKLVKPMFGNDTWLNMLKNDINNNLIDLIEDIRFKHEIDYIKNNVKDKKVIIIRIKSNREIKNNDVSEHDIDGIVPDFEIVNDGSIDEFYEKIDKVIGKVLNI